MIRSFCACGLIGLLLAATGCGDQNKAVTPEEQIPLPEKGPMPAGKPGGKGAPRSAPGPSSTAQ